jgi:hypothetical protein
VVKSYRRTYDRLLIASKICYALYTDTECEMKPEIWDARCDLREELFMKEFESELDKAVELKVAMHKPRPEL